MPFLTKVDMEYMVGLTQWFSTFLKLRHLLTPNFCSRHTKYISTQKTNRTPDPPVMKKCWVTLVNIKALSLGILLHWLKSIIIWNVSHFTKLSKVHGTLGGCPRNPGWETLPYMLRMSLKQNIATHWIILATHKCVATPSLRNTGLTSHNLFHLGLRMRGNHFVQGSMTNFTFLNFTHLDQTFFKFRIVKH